MFKIDGLQHKWMPLDCNSPRQSGSVGGRWGASLTAVGGRMYLLGGFSGDEEGKRGKDGGFFDDFHEFDVKNLMWRRVFLRGNVLHPRSNHTAVDIGGK